MKEKIRLIYSVVLVFLSFYILNCVYTPLNKPEPEAKVNPILGLLIAEELAIAPLRLTFSSCEGAEVISGNITKRISLESNKVFFVQLSGFPNTTQRSIYVVNPKPETSKSLCLQLGKANQMLDTNSPISAFESTSCDTYANMSSPPQGSNYRCVGIVNYANAEVDLIIN
jgi:hypothetical protein